MYTYVYYRYIYVYLYKVYTIYALYTYIYFVNQIVVNYNFLLNLLCLAPLRICLAPFCLIVIPIVQTATSYIFSNTQFCTTLFENTIYNVKF